MVAYSCDVLYLHITNSIAIYNVKLCALSICIFSHENRKMEMEVGSQI